jgi:hypothetical protein
MALPEGNGSASHGPELISGDLAVVFSVEVIVNGTSCTAQENIPEENKGSDS